VHDNKEEKAVLSRVSKQSSELDSGWHLVTLLELHPDEIDHLPYQLPLQYKFASGMLTYLALRVGYREMLDDDWLNDFCIVAKRCRNEKWLAFGHDDFLPKYIDVVRGGSLSYCTLVERIRPPLKSG
jgi:hypothetical protein